MNEEMSAEALVLFSVSRKDDRLVRDWLACVCVCVCVFVGGGGNVKK